MGQRLMEGAPLAGGVLGVQRQQGLALAGALVRQREAVDGQ